MTSVSGIVYAKVSSPVGDIPTISSPRLFTSNTVSMPEPILEVPQPYTVLPGSTSADTPPSVLSRQALSPEDKMIFYAVLQDIANELRRIHHEHEKHQAQR